MVPVLLLAIIAILVVIAVIMFLAFYNPYYGVDVFAMMGNRNMQNMMNQMASSHVSSINNSTFNSAYVSIPSGVSVDTATDTIHVNSSNVTIPIEGSPVWYNHSGDFWLAYNLVNPTIVVRRGAHVSFLFINMDNETHMPEITRTSPPYSYMPMMSSMMMGASGFVSVGQMLPGLSGAPPNYSYADVQLNLQFNSTGTFWYICPVPGHAQMGMYGKLVVE